LREGLVVRWWRNRSFIHQAMGTDWSEGKGKTKNQPNKKNRQEVELMKLERVGIEISVEKNKVQKKLL
jgi:hypothetical protein